ncbi:hypothetical protein NCC78_03220 [Micromonospora phytophila]|uniref:hypothetical protein n=1 Tax=Micromonospora phytophila TaxID=709888 RepID=UPI002030DEE6|nr:hypothetical protein [Micromonospora phytophila]MCM0673723.1 hypothetical protein [Micromonospora phytophila]
MDGGLTCWLDHAVTTVEELLAEAASDPRAPAWGVLYERACQEGFDKAEETLLIARLATIASVFMPADRDEVLILAGKLAVDMDERSHRRQADILVQLCHLTTDWLPTPADARSFIYRLRAVMALEGDMLWGEELERLIYDEVEVECPNCETSLFIAFGERGHFATHEDYATKSDVAQTPLLPATSVDLEGVGLRLYCMSTEVGQQSVAEAVTHVFGRATCTQCAGTFRVSDQIERY